MISFDVTREESILIRRIAKLAEEEARQLDRKYPLMEAMMDLTACHANGTPLNLDALHDAGAGLTGRDLLYDFIHDVFGIRRHIDRETGKLGGCFMPRFARRVARAANPGVSSNP